ncbi:ATP-dependent RNA helicase dbp2, partial [Borealophlyctis nickersoniae]
MDKTNWTPELRRILNYDQLGALQLDNGELISFSFAQLIRLLEKYMDREPHKTIIFTGTKRMADEITRYLRQDEFAALAIHGDKKQQERGRVMQGFRKGRAPILVATDVAARGL